MEFCASLSLKDIALQRGDRLLIKGLSLNLEKGDAIELRGANGTGKTTLLRAIAGLHQQKFGQIVFSGLDDAANNEYVVLMGHLDAIKSNESVLAQLEFWADFFGTPKSEIKTHIKRLEIERLLPLMGGGLSAGQKRRVALVRALISKRPIWLLDEPFAPLDTKGRHILGKILDEHRENGGIIIAAVHDEPPCKPMQKLDLAQYQIRENADV